MTPAETPPTEETDAREPKRDTVRMYAVRTSAAEQTTRVNAPVGRMPFHESRFGQFLGRMVNRVIAGLNPHQEDPAPENMPGLDWRVGEASRIGSRKILDGMFSNEDTTYVNSDAGVYAVADGLGGNGHNGGQYASQEAIEVAHAVARFIQSKESSPFLETPEGQKALEQIIQKEVQDANNRIYQLRSDPEHPERKGMNSTLSLAVVAGGNLYHVNVGDSRVYEVTPSDTQQYVRSPDGTVRGTLAFVPKPLTNDDSFIRFVQGMTDEQINDFVDTLTANGGTYQGITAMDIARIRRGFDSPLAAELSKYASIMTNALGVHPDQLKVTVKVKPLEGDLLLISDGASMLSPGDLMSALGRVGWKKPAGESDIHFEYTTAPHDVAEQIVAAVNTTERIGHRYTLDAYVALRAREELLRENMLNQETMMRDLDKPIEQMSFEEVRNWSAANNHAALGLLDDEELLEEWRKEFERRVIGKDDVSAVYVRTTPVTPRAITRQIFWRGNTELGVQYHGAFANVESGTVYEYKKRLKEAEDVIASLRQMYGKLGFDVNAVLGLDRALQDAQRENAALRMDFAEYRGESEFWHEREVGRLKTANEEELRQRAEAHGKEVAQLTRDAGERHETDVNHAVGMMARILEKSGRRREEIEKLTKGNKGLTQRLTERREAEDDFLSAVVAYVRGERPFDDLKGTIEIYRGRKRDDYAEALETLWMYMHRVNEGAEEQKREKGDLTTRLEEETARAKRAEDALTDEKAELSRFAENCAAVAAGTGDAQEIVETYRTARRNELATIVENIAGLATKATELQNANERADAYGEALYWLTGSLKGFATEVTKGDIQRVLVPEILRERIQAATGEGDHPKILKLYVAAADAIETVIKAVSDARTDAAKYTETEQRAEGSIVTLADVLDAVTEHYGNPEALRMVAQRYEGENHGIARKLTELAEKAEAAASVQPTESAEKTVVTKHYEPQPIEEVLNTTLREPVSTAYAKYNRVNMAKLLAPALNEGGEADAVEQRVADALLKHGTVRDAEKVRTIAHSIVETLYVSLQESTRQPTIQQPQGE